MTAAISRFFGPIITKFAFIMAALAALTIAAIAISYLVFVNFAEELSVVTDRHVPSLRTNTAIIASSNKLEDGLTRALLAGDQQSLGTAIAMIDATIAKIDKQIRGLEAEEAARMTGLLKSVRTATRNLQEARTTGFNNDRTLNGMLARVDALRRSVDATILEVKTELSAEAAKGAKETIDGVDENLTKLVEADFASIQLVLQIQADINLLSGAVITLSQRPDVALTSILRDLADAGAGRLAENVPKMKDLEVTAGYHEAIETVRTTLVELLATDANTLSGMADRILAARQSADKTLASAIDDISFELMIRSGDAIDGTKSAVNDLINGQVASLRTISHMNAAFGNYLIIALEVAASSDLTFVKTAQTELDKAATTLIELSAAIPGLEGLAEEVRIVADPQTGVVPVRRASLASRYAAEDISRSSANSVSELALQAAILGDETLAAVVQSSGELQESVATAKLSMLVITAASVVILLITMAIAYLTIARPIKRLTQRTEALSQGDLSEIQMRSDGYGEIGNMARALHVFRDGLIDKIRLEKEEKEATRQRAEADARQEREAREREKQDAERIAAEEKRDHDEQERRRDEEAARAKEEHAREAALQAAKEREEAERADLRRAAEEQRAQQAAEQSRIVEALAEGLRQLSAGNLDADIDHEFAEGYEKLRLDFNSTLDSLSQTVRSIMNSSTRIGLNVTEIDHAASNLSSSTENTAATLQQSSSALKTLTGSVESTANGAKEAEKSAATAKAEAEAGTKIVADANAAMEAIKKSSDKINNITGLIEEISFQTNLLALNAGVEAARAGDAGRGFSVVASEVRALAQKSSEAASEISQLITESSREVQNGAANVDRTGEALKAISGSVFEVSEHIVQIADSAKRQAEEIAEINGAVENLESSTQNNAAMAQEMSAASKEMRSEADSLTDAISAFSTGGDGLGGADGPIASRNAA